MKGKIISLALLFLFVSSCFCPFYSFNEKSLNGLELYLLQLGEFAFVENVFDYFHFLIQALIPFWIVIIFYCLFKRVILSYYSLISFLIFVIISSFISIVLLYLISIAYANISSDIPQCFFWVFFALILKHYYLTNQEKGLYS